MRTIPGLKFTRIPSWNHGKPWQTQLVNGYGFSRWFISPIFLSYFWFSAILMSFRIGWWFQGRQEGFLLWPTREVCEFQQELVTSSPVTSGPPCIDWMGPAATLRHQCERAVGSRGLAHWKHWKLPKSPEVLGENRNVYVIICHILSITIHEWTRLFHGWFLFRASLQPLRVVVTGSPRRGGSNESIPGSIQLLPQIFFLISWWIFSGWCLDHTMYQGSKNITWWWLLDDFKMYQGS